jgi:transposase
VSIDLWKPYQSLVKERMPKATIVADRFHVIKRLNDEIDRQRKAEKRSAQKIANKAKREAVLKSLTGSKYALLKNEEDLSEQQKEKLIEVGKVAPQLAEMYRLKKVFREIFETAENWTEGTVKLLDWMVESLPLFKQSCGMIKRWFDEVTAYFELRITNGVVEGINNKPKLIKRLGYGFSNFDNFKLRGLLPWVFPFETA